VNPMPLREHRKIVILSSAAAAVFIAFVAYLIFTHPPSYWAKIFIIWALVVPLSYRLLQEDNFQTTTSLELPGVPIGSAWRIPSRRSRAEPKKEDPKREIRSALKKLGYSASKSGENGDNLLATSSSGRKIVVKLCEGQAGILTFQDTMKAMFEEGADEAMVIAPQGSTASGKEFLHTVKSSRGVRITVWNSPRSLEAQKSR